jgi:hypothetical protein
MLSGGLCDVSLLFMEVHRESFRSADGVRSNITDMQATFATMHKANPHCRVQIMTLENCSVMLSLTHCQLTLNA